MKFLRACYDSSATAEPFPSRRLAGRASNWCMSTIRLDVPRQLLILVWLRAHCKEKHREQMIQGLAKDHHILQFFFGSAHAVKSSQPTALVNTFKVVGGAAPVAIFLVFSSVALPVEPKSKIRTSTWAVTNATPSAAAYCAHMTVGFERQATGVRLRTCWRDGRRRRG